MAFTLKIKRKSILGNKKINFSTLLSNCHLKYGFSNEFYILEEGKTTQGTAILYNPKRIGRGIFYDARREKEGIIEISYLVPTTETEISDFINVVCEIERQFKKVELYCVEEKKEYTVKTLWSHKDKMVQFSLESLHDFCCNPNYDSYILTLAMWPWVMEDQQLTEFSTCNNLKGFEEILHRKQEMDVYYAKPSLMKKQEDGKIVAFYTLTEGCASIFPIKAEAFFSLNQIKIEDGFIRFFISSEDKGREGFYSYEKFIKNQMEQGSETFDKTHILIPSISKSEIDKIIEKIK